MEVKVKKKFEALKAQKKYVLELIDQLTENQANEGVIKGKWSVAQIIYHLYLVEKHTFEAISKRLQFNRPDEKTGFKQAYRMLLLQIALALPRKYKAPSVVSDNIPEHNEMTTLLDDWKKTRDAYELLYNAQPPDKLQVKLFKHPVIGYINLLQTLDFIKAHHEHHLPQLKHLLSKIN